MRLLADAGGSDGLIARTAWSAQHDVVANQSAPLRVALEMATQEETERRALENELALLHAEWREAEEIASIASIMMLSPNAAA